MLTLMPHATPIEKRDRALIAFTLLSGARDGALASFRLKHVDLAGLTVFHDARDVRTKGRKTFVSHFFPVGGEAEMIFADYLAMLTGELVFGPGDPLFPKTAMGQGAANGFTAVGLVRECWTTAEPIRRIFRTAFAAAGLPYTNPHCSGRRSSAWGRSVTDAGGVEGVEPEPRPRERGDDIRGLWEGGAGAAGSNSPEPTNTWVVYPSASLDLAALQKFLESAQNES